VFLLFAIEAERRSTVAKGWERERENGEMLVKEHKVSVQQDEKNSGDLKYSMVTTDNKTVLYT
jgi:hypothetical protein